MIEPTDFERFDLILAMDQENVSVLRRRAPAHAIERIRLFLEYAPDLESLDVPDPYYGDERGFEEVLDLVEAASRALIAELRQARSG